MDIQPDKRPQPPYPPQKALDEAELCVQLLAGDIAPPFALWEESLQEEIFRLYEQECSLRSVAQKLAVCSSCELSSKQRSLLKRRVKQLRGFREPSTGTNREAFIRKWKQQVAAFRDELMEMLEECRRRLQWLDVTLGGLYLSNERERQEQDYRFVQSSLEELRQP